jgi:hypothetical protein
MPEAGPLTVREHRLVRRARQAVTSSAEPPVLERGRRLRFAATASVLLQRVRLKGPTAIPPAAPPSFVEGDLWGDQYRRWAG